MLPHDSDEWTLMPSLCLLLSVKGMPSVPHEASFPVLSAGPSQTSNLPPVYLVDLEAARSEMMCLGIFSYSNSFI
jgi:hypothetical protein